MALDGGIIIGLAISARITAGENSSNFFPAGSKIPSLITGASFFAPNIGAEHLVALSGDAYRYGLCTVTVELTPALCLGFACAFILPYYIKMTLYHTQERCICLS